MNRHFFDKIALSYLFIIGIASLMVMLYASNVTRQNLIEEKQTTLTNQAHYINEEYLQPFLNHQITPITLQKDLNILSDTLDICIWYCDSEGTILYMSYPEDYQADTRNLHDLNMVLPSTDTDSFSQIGRAANAFDENMLSLGIPIENHTNQSTEWIILHAPFAQISSVLKDMLFNFLIPLCVLIILAMIFLLYLTRKVLNPLSRLTQTAREYAAGNFDAKTGITSHDEIGELASNMEYMASEMNKLEEYRRAFIANISHDFRSPLTSIKGYIEAMLDGTIPPENQERYLKIVLSETHRLTKLTASMLELNNSDSYGLQLKLTDFDINPVIDSTIDLFEGVCTKRYIVIRKNCTASDTYVHADKTKIQQVIYNLTDNAIKFSPHGSTITITVSDAEDKLLISVKDSGRGIDKASQTKIWDRFYKGDTSRGKDKQGSGLGLSIIKEIIRAHDETITLNSTPGVGSEFTFSLKKGMPQ